MLKNVGSEESMIIFFAVTPIKVLQFLAGLRVLAIFDARNKQEVNNKTSTRTTTKRNSHFRFVLYYLLHIQLYYNDGLLHGCTTRRGEEGELCRGGGGIGEKLADGNENEEEDEEVVDLPSELATQLNSSTYASEEALQSALDIAGIGDLPIILVKGKPRLIMPSDQHNSFTSIYLFEFARGWGRWGFASGTHKIHLSNGKSRYPDLSYWGYSRCSRNKNGVWEPTVRDSVPDVVIQFSWKNKKGYEEEVIDDMMHLSLEQDGGTLSTVRPAVGYLIEVKFSRKRTLAGAIKGSKTQDMAGLDIYRLPHGTTISDAENLTSGAAKWTYVPGGQDCDIAITPSDLGMTGIWAMLCGEYRIPASEVYTKMSKYQKDRQLRKLAI